MVKKFFLFLLMGLFLISLSSATELAHWKFDETSGTILIDHTGTYNGTLNPSYVAVNQAGKINLSYDIADTTVADRISIADGNNLSFNPGYENYSISTWVYRDAISGGGDTDTIIQDRNTGGAQQSYMIRFEAGNTLSFSTYDGVSASDSIATTETYGAGVWYHIVAVSNTTNLMLYVNNTLVKMIALTANFTNTEDNGISIGMYSDGTFNHFFDGKIDDTRIYDHALTDNEIKGLYINSFINVTLNSPSNNIIVLRDTSINFNITSSYLGEEYVLTNISLYINGTLNETKSLSGLTDTEIFTKGFSPGAYSWYVDVCNNQSICKTSETRYFSVRNYTVNSITINSSTYETEYQSYSINITPYQSSLLTAVTLVLNGTEYSTTKSGTVWSKSLDIPSSIVGSQHPYFKITYDGANYNSTNTSQTILPIQFGICNTTLTNDFLNISFKDEDNLAGINASITSSTWTYYLGTGLVNKTYSYINTTLNYNYSFCFTPTNKTVNMVTYVQYKQGTAYPQRIWQPVVQSYNSTVTNQILYLLSSSSGIYVTFQVLDSTGDPIQSVDVTATRQVGGEDVSVGTGQTDSAGGVTFWMNPDFLNTVSFSKSGYSSYTVNLFPTQTSYTITLSSTASSTIIDYLKGITYTIKPTIGTTLQSNANYNFNLTLYSSFHSLDSFGFSLYGDDVLIGANTTSIANTTISDTVNVSSYSEIKMDFYWVINGTQINGTVTWNGFDFNNGTAFSIKNFFTHLSTYTTSGIFGLTNVGLNLIIFVVILISTGLISYKFSIQSPAQVSSIIFAFVFFFDYALGMITFKSTAMNHFPTVFIGLIMVALIVREMT